MQFTSVKVQEQGVYQQGRANLVTVPSLFQRSILINLLLDSFAHILVQLLIYLNFNKERGEQSSQLFHIFISLIIELLDMHIHLSLELLDIHIHLSLELLDIHIHLSLELLDIHIHLSLELVPNQAAASGNQ
jgi:hypothetical protein